MSLALDKLLPSVAPARAEVVIIGGGIIGCSIAYHLAALGITDVVLLERRQLTCGTTWHAAGLIGQLRATRNLTELAKYTCELLRQLERETGQPTGFRQNGSIAVALGDERFEELKRGASMARSFGLDVDVLGPADVVARYPLLQSRGVAGGIWLPKDGQTNPVDTTIAFAKGARQRGAKVLEGIEVTEILVENGRAVGVRTAHGDVRAGTVVLAAGMWSHWLARRIGLRLPLQAAEHFYVVTAPIAGLPRELPVLRVPDEWAYYKEDAGKLLIGAFEPVAKPWALDGIPRDFDFATLPDDVDHFMPVLEKAIERVPVLRETGIQTWFNGPESFTPDDRYLLGETAEVRDLFVACGFNSIGIQSSGGAGKVLAQWIQDRAAPMDLVDVDVRRMQRFQGTRAYLRDRTVESLGLLYAMHWPFRQYETARGARRSPFHDRLLAAGACMGEFAGWERPNWYAPTAAAARYEYSYGRQNWFDRCAAECRATRDAVALYDQSSFAKFLVQGADACAVLNRIGCADVDVAPGRIVYTQWLNERGGIVADLTVTRLTDTEFLVVTSAGSHARDLAWLRERMPADARCSVTDLTGALPMLGLMGPHSRALLEKLCGEELDNGSFPFGHSREIEIGYAVVRASRITYVGELGWELYIPAEFALHVFDRILAEGARFGLVPAGYHAMNACRLEKAYRHWGHDIGIDDDPLQAGLAFTVAWDKRGGFVGRDAVARARDAGPPRRRLVQIRLEAEDALVYHEEPIRCDGRIVGSVTSGMYGHRIGASLAMGYASFDEPVTSQLLAHGRFEVEVAGRRVAAQVQLPAFYDPKSLRVKDESHERIRSAA
ncbi:MAG TPA: FAD-dependent oxidoreductase [Burkholderiaceae bacterium]|nr:FAD-dependent oxidoreductase [Burkholderiaceae bacterium]